MQDYIKTSFNATGVSAATSPGTALTLVTLKGDRRNFVADSTFDVDCVLVINTVKVIYLRAGASLFVESAISAVYSLTISVYFPNGAPAAGDLLFHGML